MNFLGKVLIGLIAVFSLLFMGFALMTYATHRNWQDYVLAPGGPGQQAGLKVRYEQLQQVYNDLQEEATRLKQQIAVEEADHQSAIGKLAAELYGDPQRGIAGATQQVEALRAQKATLDQQLGNLQQDLSAIRAQNDTTVQELGVNRQELVEQNRARDAVFVQVKELTDQLAQLEGELSRLEQRHDQLVEQINDQQRLLAYGGVREDQRGQGPPEGIVGRIVGLNASERLVEISLGSDQGVAEGHELLVFRGGDNEQFLGTVQVIRTDPARSVARVVSMKANIERDDRVTASFARR